MPAAKLNVKLKADVPEGIRTSPYVTSGDVIATSTANSGTVANATVNVAVSLFSEVDSPLVGVTWFRAMTCYLRVCLGDVPPA